MQEEHKRQAAPTIAPIAQALALPKPCTHPGFEIPAPLSYSEQDLLLGISRKERWKVNFNTGVPIASPLRKQHSQLEHDPESGWGIDYLVQSPLVLGGRGLLRCGGAVGAGHPVLRGAIALVHALPGQEGVSVVDRYPLHLPLSSHTQSWPSLTP